MRSIFKSLIFTLLLIPGIAYAGAWSIGGVTIDLRTITLLNTGCINIEDSLGASVGVLCLDGSDDLNIGDATGVDNMNFDIATSGVFDLQINTASVFTISATLADFSGLDVLVDNGKFYQVKQSTASTVRNLLGFSTDVAQLGALTNDLDILGLTNINILSGAGTNTVVEIQAATGRDSLFRLQEVDLNQPVTTLMPSDVYGQIGPSQIANGGLLIQGITEGDANGALFFRAIIGISDPTDSNPVVIFRAGKSDGSTSIADLAAAETAYQFSDSTGDDNYLTILGSGAEVLVNSDTTGDAWKLTADALTTGNLIIAQTSITADGLTNRSAGNNLVDITVSRVDSRTSGTTADDFDLMSLARTQEASGASGTLTAAGSVLKLENIATASAGTLTDTVNVLEVVQDADSAGDAVFINQDGNATSLNIDSESTTADVITINGDPLTTGNMLFGTATISTDGLTARSAGNNLIDFNMSRTEESTSATTSDDYDLMSLSRTSITTGAGGTLNSTGSVLKLENTVTQTAGTLADTVAVLELVQDTDSTGITLSVDSNGANTKPIMSIENTAGDIEIFRTDATPESAVTGSIGDLAIDGTGGILYIKNTGSATNTGWNAIGGMPTFKSYTFVARDAASGVNFSAGFYNAPTSSVVLTIGGSVTQTHGGANAPYAAHAIVVASGAGATDLVLTVSGTSILDDGTRNGADSEIIVADTDTASINDYFETTKKWLGQITYTLTGASGAFTFNYGHAKYDDFGNRDFTVTDFETVGLANATDGSFDIELLHHKATGWTYSAGSFVPGSTVIAGMNAIHSTEQDLDAGEPFAFKRAGLSTLVSGNNAEGIVIRVTTGTNNSISYMDSHVGVLLR